MLQVSLYVMDEGMSPFLLIGRRRRRRRHRTNETGSV